VEGVGFILFLLGAAGMDSKGNGFYVAAGFIILGCFLMSSKGILKVINSRREL